MLISDLHVDCSLLGAQLPQHVHAVAVQTGNPEGEHIDAPLPAHVLLNHIYIVANAAGSDNCGVAKAFNFFATIRYSKYTSKLSLGAH